jgi:hypothetical protein
MMPMGPHAELGNFPRAVEYTSGWVNALICHARDHGLTRIEVTPEATKAWTDHVIETTDGLLFTEVDSWMTGINHNLEGKTGSRVMRGHLASRQRCEAAAGGGIKSCRWRSRRRHGGRGSTAAGSRPSAAAGASCSCAADPKD